MSIVPILSWPNVVLHYNVLLFVSDAILQMIKAGKMIHLTYLAHAFHGRIAVTI